MYGAHSFFPSMLNNLNAQHNHTLSWVYICGASQPAFMSPAGANEASTQKNIAIARRAGWFANKAILWMHP